MFVWPSRLCRRNWAIGRLALKSVEGWVGTITTLSKLALLKRPVTPSELMAH